MLPEDLAALRAAADQVPPPYQPDTSRPSPITNRTRRVQPQAVRLLHGELSPRAAAVAARLAALEEARGAREAAARAEAGQAAQDAAEALGAGRFVDAVRLSRHPLSGFT